MAITIASVESELILDFGPYLRLVALDSATTNGSNASLSAPIRRAITACGGTVADPPSITDADLQTIKKSFDRFMLFTRFFLIDRIWGNWARVDLKAGENEQKLSQLADRLEKRRKELLDQIKEPDLQDVVIVEGPPAIGLIKEGSRVYFDPFDPYGLSPDGFPYRN